MSSCEASAPGFLSRPWLDAAVRAAAGMLPRIPGVDLVVTTRVTDRGLLHEQRYRDGQLTAWDVVRKSDAAIVARRGHETDFAAWCRDGSGLAIAARTTFCSDTADVVMPPLIGDRATRLPRIAGATCAVTFHLARSPFGADVPVWYRFEDGELIGEGIGTGDRPGVEIVTTAEALLRVRAGEMAMGELVYHGELRRGSIEDLSLLQGLFGSEELFGTRAEQALDRYFLRLARLMGSDGFAAWQRCVAAMTEER